MIVLPMAGLSQRFAREGYASPKYMLPLHGRPVFDYAALSFASLFGEERFVFICLDVADTPAFVRDRTNRLGIARCYVVVLPEPTRGQADTVSKGLAALDLDPTEPLTIFNIDSFRPGYQAVADAGDGLLEVFKGEGDGWSFVGLGEDGRVNIVTEKRRISDLCCTGLYRFASTKLFIDALADEARAPSQDLPELYVAPCYNQLIARGFDIVCHVIPDGDVIFCGVPREYEALRATTAWTARFAAQRP
jgi:dTDP-glucose pyrophosphorylase